MLSPQANASSEEFVLPIAPEKFKSTNAPWNALMLNDPWSVGYVTTLIELGSFEKKEDWERFYYESGQQRAVLLAQLTPHWQATLNNESLIRLDRQAIRQMAWHFKNLNTQYGRTQEDLYRKGRLLYETVKNNGLGLTVEDCFVCVQFRVIGETWNGVMVREKNTIVTLAKHFPDVDFKKVSGEIDHRYAVDYELYKDGVLSVALQIKPRSYTWTAPYIQKAKSANLHKNRAYFERFGVPVYGIGRDTKKPYRVLKPVRFGL